MSEGGLLIAFCYININIFMLYIVGYMDIMHGFFNK